VSDFAVKVERVLHVDKHPNADRLDLVTIHGWNCVAQAGTFKAGDLCVYIPIDSILPATLEDFIFGVDAKVKLSRSRVRTIKLRGAISQGLVVSWSEIDKYLGERLLKSGAKEGLDLTENLGVTKYEPPVSEIPPSMRGTTVSKKNPAFKEYTDLSNIKYYPELFAVGEDVVITEKIHGTNFRTGWVPFHASTTWKRFLKFLRLAPQWEFVYGSRRVQMQDRYQGGSDTFYQKNGSVKHNVYSDTVRKYDLKKKLNYGEVVYGEIYGSGIQKGYTYGCKEGEHKLVLFDVYDSLDGEYLDTDMARVVASNKDLPFVPVLFNGPYREGLIEELKVGPSVLSPSQAVREGVVIKPGTEATFTIVGRKALKCISEAYLLKDQSEFH